MPATNLARQNKWFSHMELSRAASDPILLRFAFGFASRSRCGLVLGPFGSVFGSFWIRFGSVLASFWVGFGFVFAFRFQFVFISFSIRSRFSFISHSFAFRSFFVFVSLSFRIGLPFVSDSFSLRLNWSGSVQTVSNGTTLIRATSGVSVDR